jgi:hypothetical protein
MYLEIPEDDLMDDEELVAQEFSNQQSSNVPIVQNNHLQIGMVRIFGDIPRIPSYQETLKIFSSQLKDKLFLLKEDKTVVQVPKDWVDFFVAMLLSPPHFKWAKHFLESRSVHWLQSLGPMVNLAISPNYQETASFSCPRLAAWQPLSAEAEDNLGEDFANPPSPNTTKARKGKGKEPLVDLELRRSTRLKTRNRGFKGTNCRKSNCLGCSHRPSILDNSIIRRLGAEFCQIDLAPLTDDNLQLKKPAKPIGRKKAPSKKPKDNNEDEA